MNSISLVFVCASIVAILSLPRRWVFLPFLMGTCYTTYGQGIDIGPMTLFVVRMLLLAGFARVVLKRERLSGGMKSLDRLVIAMAGAAIVSSFGHKEISSSLVYRLGLAFDCAGVYFLARIFIRSREEVVFLCRIIAFLLAPVALEMLSEKITGQNRFAIFGGVSETCQVREGKVRAQGPFMHPILGGTAGALCLPLMAGLWRHDRKAAWVGLAATSTMVVTSASSGPMMSAIFAVGALFFWRYRIHLQTLRWVAVFVYLVLNMVMKVPAYYLLARLDLAGGSTGYHRAELINSAIRHLGEWWLAGTDYTVHWMPTGASWSPDHTDITNQYIQMGVVGGLPLMLLFIGVLALAFAYVGRALRAAQALGTEWRFLIWAMGASLFANAATCISVAYFDQSYLFLYLIMGSIGSLGSLPVFSPVPPSEEASDHASSEEWPAKPAVQ